MKNTPENHPNIKSEAGKAIVMLLVTSGFPYHRIGGLFDENAGRVSEVVSSFESNEK